MLLDTKCKFDMKGQVSDLGEPSDRNGVERSGERESSSNEKPSAKPLPSPSREKKPPLHNSNPNMSNKYKETESKSSNDSKKDKTKLRKGKWTVEEEEYTSRIIHHSSTGLLTLPEGTTLRSYLADRLNCDPMRITKKFIGACCLGRRVYHLRDRPRASSAEVEMAKAEIKHLEQRFRMRIEQEQSGVPLARRQEIFLAQRQNGVNTIFPVQSPSPGSLLHPWVQPYPDMTSSNALSLAVAGANRPPQASLSSQYPLAALSSTANPWLLPIATDTVLPTATLPTIPQNDASMHILNNLLTSLAWAQATVSISPAVAMLQQQQQIQNEANQRQLRTAYEEQKKEQGQRELLEQKLEEFQNSKGESNERSSTIAAKQAPPESGSGSKKLPEISPAQQLRRNYEAHLESLKKSSSKQHEAVAAPSDIVQTRKQDGETSKSTKSMATLLTNMKESRSFRDGARVEGQNLEDNTKDAGGEEKSDYEEAGTILLGFVNSLRQSYEDAVEETETASVGMVQKPKPQEKKRSREIADRMVLPTSPRYPPPSQSRIRPASVTDASTLCRSESSSGSSSQPAESSSSIEDSDSKSDKTEQSSSEESEKEFTANQSKTGPPRKRLRPNRIVKGITAQNLAEHSKRMSEEFHAAKGNSF